MASTGGAGALRADCLRQVLRARTAAGCKGPPHAAVFCPELTHRKRAALKYSLDQLSYCLSSLEVCKNKEQQHRNGQVSVWFLTLPHTAHTNTKLMNLFLAQLWNLSHSFLYLIFTLYLTTYSVLKIIYENFQIVSKWQETAASSGDTQTAQVRFLQLRASFLENFPAHYRLKNQKIPGHTSEGQVLASLLLSCYYCTFLIEKMEEFSFLTQFTREHMRVEIRIPLKPWFAIPFLFKSDKAY